ncbi:MAG: hypothetical protein NTZ83_03495 [Candidatus Pacearchaeota archaeon]|nr:hypothetical protein [Candidatus Pacearchaeota archaeon]
MKKGEEEMKENIQEEKQEKKEGKRRGRTFFEVGSFLLLIVLIILILIVVQVPYTTTNAVKETVPVEKCVQKDIPFVSTFKMGLNYDAASKIYSSDGEALYRYSELKNYLYATIRNTGEEKGVYCINAQAYMIENFTNEEDSLALFQNLILLNSNKTQKLDNWNSDRYTYPVCTENPVPPTATQIISFWTPFLLSKNAQEQYNPDNVYILFTIVPPISEQCNTENVEKTTEQEVTRYCNAWKHVVGKC